MFGSHENYNGELIELIGHWIQAMEFVNHIVFTAFRVTFLDLNIDTFDSLCVLSFRMSTTFIGGCEIAHILFVNS